MNPILGKVRRPVRRGGGQTYLLITLLSFGASVTLTRLILDLVGYPKLARGELHLAHVLFGGLLLFAASLLPLIFTNRWVYTTGAILAGTGVGLFIDEVGKFITQANDYFHPIAAPIVYALFLATVLVYLEVRRPRERDARDELYHALDGLKEVLDHDLDPVERSDLENRLMRVVVHAEHQDFSRLADHLLTFLNSEVLHVVPDEVGFWEKVQARFRRIEKLWLQPIRLKAALIGGLLGLGGMALIDLTQVLLAARDPTLLSRTVAEWVSLGQVASETGSFWFAIRVTLEGGVGFILVMAAGFLIRNKDAYGVGLGTIGLLLSLTVVDLLVFYFEQFSTIITSTVQFTLLMGLLYYRRRILRAS